MRRLLLLLLLTAAGPAWAQQAPPQGNPSGEGEAAGPTVAPVPASGPIPIEPQPAVQAPAPRPARGLSVQAEAGVLGFSGPLSGALRVGPAWGAETVIQAHHAVGAELRYQGASNPLSGADARLLQNAVQLLARVPLAPERYRLRPFVGAGVGMAWYTLSQPVEGYRDDSLGQVPVSAGVNLRLRPPGPGGALTVGLRGDYEWLLSNQFAPEALTPGNGVFTTGGGNQYRGELTFGGAF